MPSTAFAPALVTTQPALTTATGDGLAVDCRNFSQITVYIVGSSGISAGAVTIEESATFDYAGTWAAVGSAVTAVASTTVATHLTEGAYAFVRTRVSTTISGGTIQVLILGS